MSQVASGQARALLEHVLRGGESLAEEYPLIFGPEPSGRMVSIEQDGRVRSACAVLVRDLLLPGFSLRVGLIGSVATDPEYRGQGLASRVLAQAERELAADGCLLALLWADDAAFYERRGWREVGSELDFLLPPETIEDLPAPDGVRAAAPDDRGAIHRLYSLHRHRVDRSPRETAELLACPDMEVLVVQRERDVIAYSCLGRGADLDRTVHEWAGSPEDTLRLLRAHLERRELRGQLGEDGAIYLMTPASSAALHAELIVRGLTAVPGILGHGKLLDPLGSAALVARLAGAEASFEVDTGAEGDADARPGCATLFGPTGHCRLDTDDLLDLLIPAHGTRSAVEDIAAATGLELSCLPVLPWVWGLDSI